MFAAVSACGAADRISPAPTASALWFEDVANQRGLRFVYESGHRDRFYLPEIMGGGAALFDMDNDGDLDAYLVQGGRVPGGERARGGNRLFRNRGDGTFDDVTAASGAEGHGYGMGVTAGDYDNDGDVDLYVTNVGPNILLRNDGGGRFVDVTRDAGVGDAHWSTSAAFLDYDADGDLDLYVANYINWTPAAELPCFSLTGVPDYCSPRNYNAPAPDTLYRNNGDGTFTDVSAQAGIRVAFGNGLGVVAGDFDEDRRVDVFVANDSTMNQLWLNQGGGRFRDAALLRGCALDQDGAPKAGMGVHAADPDHDGDLDLLVVNLDGESDSFYRNHGPYFTDDTVAVGLRAVSRPFTRFGMAMLDFDNDGWLDLFEANGRVGRQSEMYGADPFAEPALLFQGVEGGFKEVQPRGGTARRLIATSRAAAFGDLDNDGGLDIVVVNRDAAAFLLHNVVAPRGHWTGLRLLDRHGRDALGAEVTLTVGSRHLRVDARAAYSYLASNDPRVHVGLGPDTAVRDVRVRWPDGTTETFGGVPIDTYTTLREDPGRR